MHNSGIDVDIADQMIDISTSVVDIFRQSCTEHIQNQQEIILVDVGRDVNIEYLRWSQVIDGVIKCVQSNDSMKQAIDGLWNALGMDNDNTDINNEVIDVLKNYAFYGATIFVLILIVLSTQRSNYIAYLVLLMVLLLYISAAKLWNGFPYNLLRPIVQKYIAYTSFGLVCVILILSSVFMLVKK